MRLVQEKSTYRTETLPLSASEQVQASCMIAREQLEVGDYDAACAALQQWWRVGEWPSHVGLSDRAAAELFLTSGMLSGWLASAKSIQGGQKPAEALLNCAIVLFERLGDQTNVIQGRIEIGCCYWRQGLFEPARTILRSAIQTLGEEDRELKAVALIRLAMVERHAGRLHDALKLLDQATPLVNESGPWTAARFQQEFATTLKNMGVAEGKTSYFDRALNHYSEALLLFEEVGNHRYAAAVENNYGYLLLMLKRFDEAQRRLDHARKLFDGFGDKVRRAQVDETLAQLYQAAEKYELAERSIALAVDTLETSGEEAILAEALNYTRIDSLSSRSSLRSQANSRTCPANCSTLR